MKTMNILDLQKCQLSKNNETSWLMDALGSTDFLGEMSSNEGDMIPFVIRTGPMSRPDPGVLKKFSAVEVNGHGRSFVMVWVDHRLVACGVLFAQEGPSQPRRLNIPRGLGNGYGIDLYIAHQGRLTGFEVFYDVDEVEA